MLLINQPYQLICLYYKRSNSEKKLTSAVHFAVSSRYKEKSVKLDTQILPLMTYTSIQGYAVSISGSVHACSL